MKTLSLLLTLFLSLSVHAGFEGLNASTSLKVFNRINCSTGLTCTRTSKGTFNVVSTGVGVVQNRVLATATQITAAQCGSTFYNSGAVDIYLPYANLVPGCQLFFATTHASNFDVRPATGGEIMVLTNSSDDAVRSSTIGNTLVLEAASSTQWSVRSIYGTWNDIN